MISATAEDSGEIGIERDVSSRPWLEVLFALLHPPTDREVRLSNGSARLDDSGWRALEIGLHVPKPSEVSKVSSLERELPV